MKVWIDPELCTGVALCEQTGPEVFVIGADGIARVVGPDGRAVAGRAAVDAALRLDKLLSTLRSRQRAAAEGGQLDLRQVRPDSGYRSEVKSRLR